MSVSGSGLPAQRCSYDANGFVIGCSATTIAVHVTWSGQGPVARESLNDHLQVGNVKTSRRFNGVSRNADASGTVAGLTVTSNDLFFADIGRSNQAAVCIGTAFC